MKKGLILGVAAILILGLAAWWLSPHQVVKRKTESLLEVFSLGRDVGTGGRHLDVYRLNGLLADEVELQTPFTDRQSVRKDEVESAYSWLCRKAEGSELGVSDWVSLEISDDSAVVRATVEGVVELPKIRPVDGSYDVTFRWQRMEDDWRLVEVDWQDLPQ